MPSLTSYIKQIPKNNLAFVTKNKTTTYADILNIYEKNIKTIGELQKFSVVLRGFNRYEFSILLCLLDGNVSQILFLPSDIDNTLANTYIANLNINYTLEFKDDVLKYTKINETNSTNKILDTKWIIPTSGTTSTPKLVVHTLKSLTTSTKTDIKNGFNFNWGLVFDIYRFSGIQVFLQSFLSGSTLIIANEDDDIQSIMTLFYKYNCNTISATPSFYIKALMTKEFLKLNLKNITLGGEIASQNILNSLSNSFKNANIRHIYASTEAGVGFSIDDKKEGFPKSYLDNGINNIQLRINEKRILLIKAKQSSQKYQDDKNMYDKNGYINTDDLVQIKDNRVYFLGRNSGAINVGGNKVIPEEIEKVLLEYHLIQNAYVFAKKSNIMGSLVYANITLKNSSLDIKEIKKDIINHCKKHMESFKVPAILKVVESIDITSSGKIKRG